MKILTKIPAQIGVALFNIISVTLASVVATVAAVASYWIPTNAKTNAKAAIEVPTKAKMDLLVLIYIVQVQGSLNLAEIW